VALIRREPQVTTLADGQYCSVVMITRLWDQIEIASMQNAEKAKSLARCRANMKIMAQNGPRYLNNKDKFRNEGSWKLGVGTNKKITIYVFKANQLRIYGAQIKKRFICTEAEITKKRDAANQELLKRAATKLAPFIISGDKS
jgi:hypothetical protein